MLLCLLYKLITIRWRRTVLIPLLVRLDDELVLRLDDEVMLRLDDEVILRQEDQRLQAFCCDAVSNRQLMIQYNIRFVVLKSWSRLAWWRCNLQSNLEFPESEILKTLLNAFVSCRLDYCNSLYAGLPACDSSTTVGTEWCCKPIWWRVEVWQCHSSLAWRFHWLPIKELIKFKIEVLTYKALNGLAPSYLLEMLVPFAVNPAIRRKTDLPTVVT